MYEVEGSVVQIFNILSGYSIDYKKLIHEILDIVVDFFIEIGGNLRYDEIYSLVFPLHMRDDEQFIRSHLEKLHRHIIDDYNHQITALDEYTLYCILSFVYSATEDDFRIDDIISEKLESNRFSKLSNEELKYLGTMEYVDSLIGICFDDVDFLDIGMYFDWFKISPDLLEKYAHIDLDYYKEIMPADILSEYNKIKKNRENIDVIESDIKNNNIKNKEEFYDIVSSAVKRFNELVVHKKLSRVLNKEKTKSDEKDVQIIFSIFLKLFLEPYDILVNPEVDTMRGTVDFYISLGLKYRALIELKLASSTQKKEGLKYQLPMYLIAEDIEFGIFVLICYDQKSYDESIKFNDIARNESERFKKKISFFRINSTGDIKSASKIRSDDELELEDYRKFN